ncbi:MAG: class I SAM-dependent methyltransferase [Gemmatimonadales bacterium]
MGRLHLLEIHDQPWCPRSLRDALTDFLQFALNLGRGYAAVAPVLRRAIARADADRIVDLCSGAGGPWRTLGREIPVPVLLTDKYPNRAPRGSIPFHPEPVDATAVPADLRGFRTLFTSFHHFRPREARAILADAVRRRQGIGVFEISRRAPREIVLIALTWLAILVLVPFIRPLRWSRLVWTYLPPVLPLMGLFDGVVSCLRTYSRAELWELVRGLDTYEWEIGETRTGWSPLVVTYLVGVPRR